MSYASVDNVPLFSSLFTGSCKSHLCKLGFTTRCVVGNSSLRIASVGGHGHNEPMWKRPRFLLEPRRCICDSRLGTLSKKCWLDLNGRLLTSAIGSGTPRWSLQKCVSLLGHTSDWVCGFLFLFRGFLPGWEGYLVVWSRSIDVWGAMSK